MILSQIHLLRAQCRFAHAASRSEPALLDVRIDPILRAMLTLSSLCDLVPLFQISLTFSQHAVYYLWPTGTTDHAALRRPTLAGAPMAPSYESSFIMNAVRGKRAPIQGLQLVHLHDFQHLRRASLRDVGGDPRICLLVLFRRLLQQRRRHFDSAHSSAHLPALRAFSPSLSGPTDPS